MNRGLSQPEPPSLAVVCTGERLGMVTRVCQTGVFPPDPRDSRPCGGCSITVLLAALARGGVRSTSNNKVEKLNHHTFIIKVVNTTSVRKNGHSPYQE